MIGVEYQPAVPTADDWRHAAAVSEREHGLVKGVAWLRAHARVFGQRVPLSGRELSRLAGIGYRTARRAIERAQDCGLVEQQWNGAEGRRSASGWRLVRVGLATVRAIGRRCRARAQNVAWREAARLRSAARRAAVGLGLVHGAKLAQEVIPEEREKGLRLIKPMSSASETAVSQAWGCLFASPVGSDRFQRAALDLVRLGQAASVGEVAGLFG